MLYLLQDLRSGLIKVGISGDPAERIPQINDEFGVQCRFVAYFYVTNDRLAEKHIFDALEHRALRSRYPRHPELRWALDVRERCSRSREWFDITPRSPADLFRFVRGKLRRLGALEEYEVAPWVLRADD